MIVDCKMIVADLAIAVTSVVVFESDVCPDLEDKVVVHNKDKSIDKTYSVVSREFHVEHNHPMVRTTNGTNHSLELVVCKVKEVR